jgi:hypothetical protein
MLTTLACLLYLLVMNRKRPKNKEWLKPQGLAHPNIDELREVFANDGAARR